MAPKKKEIIDNGNCLICLDTLEDPVSTSCKHAFCRKCIEYAIDDEPKCPTCGTQINKKDLQEVVVAAATSNASKKAKTEETTANANAQFHFGSVHEDDFLSFHIKNGELFMFDLKTQEKKKIANQNFNCTGSSVNIMDWTKNKLPYKVENEEQMKMRVNNGLGFITGTDCSFRVFTSQNNLVESVVKMGLNCGYLACGSNSLLYLSHNLIHFTNEPFSCNNMEVNEFKNCTINILIY